MTSRKNWILLVFGLSIFSAVFMQGHAAETEDYDYIEDGNNEGKSREPPVITTVPEQIDAVEGDDIRLECKGHHFDEYALIWTKLPSKIISVDGEPTSLNDSARYEHPSKGSVLMKNALLSDAGSYECKIQQNVTIVHNVTVRERNQNLLLPHMTLNPAHLATANHNDSLILTCTVRTEGKQMEFYWLKKNQQESKNLKLTNAIITRLSNTVAENKLTLDPISRHDAGDYLCFFQDSMGTAESTVRIKVRFPPVVVTRRDAVHAGVGKTLELRCVVYAVPNPELKWFKSDTNDKNIQIPVIQKHGYQMRSDQHTHYLFIANLTEHDFGTYTCEATNSFAKAGVATIDVVGAPSQPLLMEDKTKLGEEHMSYHLVWKVESSIPIERNVLQYKREPDTAWIEISVTGIPITNQPSFFEVAYTLANLTSSSSYEATLKSQNKLGWSTHARIHRFSINGKSYTDTMELSDDKGSKAPGQIGSSTFLIPASIFLLVWNSVLRW